MRRLILPMLAAGILAWGVGLAYRMALARVVEGCFALLGASVSLSALEVLAPLDVCLFLALCAEPLAASARRTFAAALFGALVLVIAEVLLCMWLVWAAYQESRGAAGSLFLATFRSSVMASYTLGAPLVLWWVLVAGRHEPTPESPRSSSPRRPRSSQPGPSKPSGPLGQARKEVRRERMR